eukprot:scpid45627/ scgid10572/ 
MAGEATQTPMKFGVEGALLLCRLVYVLVAAVASATIATGSANGFSNESGYYCLYGNFHRCNGLLALSIMLLGVGVMLLMLELFWRVTNSRLLVLPDIFEISAIVLAMVSFILQVTFYHDSGITSVDATTRAGMAFTLLTCIMGITNIVIAKRAMKDSAPLPPQSLRMWTKQKLFDAPEVAMLAAVAVFSVVSTNIVGAFGIDSGVGDNSTCLFHVEVETFPDAACTTVRACNIVAMLSVPCLIFEVSARNWMLKVRQQRLPVLIDVGRMILILTLIGLQFATFSLVLRNWLVILASPSIEFKLTGGARYGGGGVIALHLLSALLLLVIMLKWFKDMTAQPHDASDSGEVATAGDYVACGSLKKHYAYIFAIEVTLEIWSAIVLAMLFNANYDGTSSPDNGNSACIYAESGPACNFVVATAALSLVYQFMVFFSRFKGCFPEYLSLTDWLSIVDFFVSVGFFVMWLASSIVQANRLVHGSIDYGKTILIVAVVFSFLASAAVLLKVVAIFWCICRNYEAEDSSEQSEARTPKHRNWRLIVLLHVLVGSLLAVVLIAEDGHWDDDSPALAGHCILEPSSSMCRAVLATYCSSLFFAVVLILYTAVTERRASHGRVGLSISLLLLLLTCSMMSLINAKWQSLVREVSRMPLSARQYNAGYTLAADSAFVAAGWLILTMMWGWEVSQHHPLCCTVTSGSADLEAARNPRGTSLDERGASGRQEDRPSSLLVTNDPGHRQQASQAAHAVAPRRGRQITNEVQH